MDCITGRCVPIGEKAHNKLLPDFINSHMIDLPVEGLFVKSLWFTNEPMVLTN